MLDAIVYIRLWGLVYSTQADTECNNILENIYAGADAGEITIQNQLGMEVNVTIPVFMGGVKSDPIQFTLGIGQSKNVTLPLPDGYCPS